MINTSGFVYLDFAGGFILMTGNIIFFKNIVSEFEGSILFEDASNWYKLVLVIFIVVLIFSFRYSLRKDKIVTLCLQNIYLRIHEQENLHKK